MNIWNNRYKSKRDSLPNIWSPRAPAKPSKLSPNATQPWKEKFKMNALFRINGKRLNGDPLSCDTSPDDYVRINLHNLKIHHRLIKKVNNLVRFNNQCRGMIISSRLLGSKIRSISRKRDVNTLIKKRGTEEFPPCSPNQTLGKVKERKCFSPSPPRTAFENVNEFIEYYDQSLKRHIETLYKH